MISLKKFWKLLAHELKIRQSDVVDLEEDMSSSRKRILDVVESMLGKWRRKNGNRATLRSLIIACTSLELEDVAAVLEKIQNGDLR